jgi:hypothetical protein
MAGVSEIFRIQKMDKKETDFEKKTMVNNFSRKSVKNKWKTV